jgi:hypothetical protein
MKNYVGRKIRGFRFEHRTDGVGWTEWMEKHIDKIGEIIEQGKNVVRIRFDNYHFCYPISLIEQHLVDVDTNVDTSEKNDDTFLDFSCILGTCGHDHLIEETPEIPQLGEGVLMKVSEDGVNYKKTYVIAILADGRFLDRNKLSWKHARPIPKLPQYTHAELVEQLGHDFEYGGK